MADPTTSPNPVKTGAPTQAPDRVPMIDDPERYYQPQRLCPDQSKDGGWRARP